MARYTVELREIVKSGAKVFDFPYTLYDETLKPEFEERFINHFFFREIGTETFGRFQHYLKCKCDEVLPYYNVLFKTALYEYDVKNNYNLTETFTKTNTTVKTTTGEATQNANTTDTAHTAGTVNRDSDVTANGSKTSSLNSTTTHTDNMTFTKDDTLNETSDVTHDNTIVVDDKKVGSDTPNGLLSMADIKTNVYASRADIQDGTTTTDETTNSTADKTGHSDETTDRTIVDTVTATSHDTTSDTTSDTTAETTDSTTTANGTATTTANTEQNENQTNTETYTLDRVGDIGVDTTPDKLKKHIELQRILTTVYTQFFDDCEDLFMQLY